MKDGMGMKRRGFRKRCYRVMAEPAWKGLEFVLIRRYLGGGVLMH